MSKTDHLAKAKDYIAKGDTYHRKAAEEIVAALKEDSVLSYATVATRVGKSKSWVAQLVQSFTSGQHLNDGEDFKVEWAREKPSTTARKALRDPDQRRQVIESLEPEERAEIVREVSRSVTTPHADDGATEVWESVEKAPERDLSAQAAKLVATASQLEVLLAEGAEFKRLDAKGLQRMDRDLERVKDTAEKLREQITAQSRVRRVA